MPTEAEVKSAQDVLARDYWDDVRGLVEEVERRIRDKEITRADDVPDAIHEICENTQRVIYTWQAQLTICFADGDGMAEYAEEFGAQPTVEQAAWFVLNRDVSERVYSGEVYAALENGDSK